MSNTNKYFPYIIADESTHQTTLTLVKWQQYLHSLLKKIIPAVIVLIIACSTVILVNDNQMNTPTLLAFAVSILACLAMLNMRSVREIKISKNKIELKVQQWFSTKEEEYQLQKGNSITWQEQGGRGANWCFRIHQYDSTKVILRLPIKLFSDKVENKDAFVALLSQYQITVLPFDQLQF